MVELVCGAHAAAQGRRALDRPLPVPRGAHAELLRQPGRQALLLLRLRRQGRRDLVRPRDRAPRLRGRDRVARRAVPRRARVRGRRRRGRTRSAAAASGCSALLEQAAALLRALPLGHRRRASRCATYLAGRGLGEEVCREFRLGLAPRRPSSSPKARERRASRRRSCGRRARRPARQRLLLGAADVPARRRARPRRRLPGAPAARRRPAAGEVRELAGGRALPQGRRSLYGLHRARAAIAKQERAIVVEGNTDVLALRQAGIEPVVASMGTALTERQLQELGAAHARALPLLRRATRPARRRRCAAWSSPRRRASTCASSRCRPAPTRRTTPTGSRSGSRDAEPYLLLPRAARDRARRGPAGRRSIRSASCWRRPRTRRSGRTRSALRPTCSTCRASSRPRSRRTGERRRAPTVSRKMLQAGDRLERDVPGGARARPGRGGARARASSATSTSTPPSTAGCARSSPARPGRRETAALHAELWATAEHGRRHRRPGAAAWHSS